MTIKSVFLTTLILFVLLAYDQQNQVAISNNSGAPAGNTGSPFDNKTCARSGCHVGTATPIAGIITSTIPPSGYIPGTTYTITCSCSQTGINKWGFQVSPMNIAGVLIGTPIITNTTTTKLVSSKYVTHNAAGTAGSGAKTWTFNWIAPVAGTGSVTFYGAFNFTNSNNMASGDIIHTSTLTVNENTSTGVFDPESMQIQAFVSPNPVIRNITVNYQLEKQDLVFLTISNPKGEIISTLSKGRLMPGIFNEEIMMDEKFIPGIYFVKIQAGNDYIVKKIIKL